MIYTLNFKRAEDYMLMEGWLKNTKISFESNLCFTDKGSFTGSLTVFDCNRIRSINLLKRAARCYGYKMNKND